MGFDYMQHMKKEPLKETDGGVVGTDTPEKEDHYSYGLALTLDHEDLQKVGLDCDDPECQTGNYLKLDVLAKVTGVHKTDAGHSLNLQITHMCIEGEEESDDGEDDHYDGKVIRAAGPY